MCAKPMHFSQAPSLIPKIHLVNNLLQSPASLKPFQIRFFSWTYIKHFWRIRNDISRFISYNLLSLLPTKNNSWVGTYYIRIITIYMHQNDLFRRRVHQPLLDIRFRSSRLNCAPCHLWKSSHIVLSVSFPSGQWTYLKWGTGNPRSARSSHTPNHPIKRN